METNEKLLAPEVTEPVRFGPDPVADVLGQEDHKRLVEHIFSLCQRAEPHRQARIKDMEAIEIDLLGLVVAQGDDGTRRDARREGKGAAAPDSIYPFGYLQLQDLTTQIVSVIFPAEAPYAVAAGPGNQDKATALVKAFRHAGLQFDHRNAVHAAAFDAIALNFGAMEFVWDRVRAMGAPSTATGTATASSYMHGMRMRPLDPYNTTFDHTVLPERVQLEGQFAAYFSRVSAFSLRRDLNTTCFLSEERLTALEAQIDKQWSAPGSIATTAGSSSRAGPFSNIFYHQSSLAASRAEILKEHGSNRRRASQDMSGVFSGVKNSDVSLLDYQTTVHKIVAYVRLRPNQWGLRRNLTNKRDLAAEAYSVWQIHIIGDGYISYAAPVDVEMDRIPIALATTNYAKHHGRAFTLGSHAAQLGLYVSMLLNYHKRAMRKGLEGGATIFNPNVVDLNSAADISSGLIAANMNAHDDDIRKHVMQLSSVPDTAGNLRDAQQILGLMREFLPANAQPAMMGLDRATQYQAQAVMLTSLQQALWYGALLDGQLLVPARFFMHYWTIKHAPTMQYFDEEQKSLLRVEGNELKQLEFAIVQSQPLMGHDRLRLELIVRDLVNIMMQAGDQITPTSAMMLKYYVQVAGITLDMDDFEEQINEMLRQRQAAQEAANAPAGGIPQTNPNPQPARSPIIPRR